VTGELDERPQVTINIQQTQEWLAIQQVVLDFILTRVGRSSADASSCWTGMPRKSSACRPGPTRRPYRQGLDVSHAEGQFVAIALCASANRIRPAQTLVWSEFSTPSFFAAG